MNFRTSTAALLSLMLPFTASAQSSVGFGSAEQVNNRINQDRRDRELPLKDRLAEDGIDIAVDYSALALEASDVFPDTDDSASGGMLRFYGSWQATETGSMIWKIEHRHSYTDTEPRFLGFNAGVAGLQAPPFSDQEGRLTNFYWKQRYNEGRATVVGGFLDVTDYLDVYAVASPWTGFVNFAFSTGNSTIALPGDAALGVAGASMLSDNLFVIAGLTDMESDPTDPFEGFDTFFNDNNYFKSIEFGWTSAQENIYVDNIHVTFWDADESEFMNQAEDQGINLSATKIYGPWLPFVRISYADEGSLLGIDESYTAGFAYYGLGGEGNTLGAAINFADAGADDDQVTFEVFYLIKPVKFWEITPDIQVIENPASNPDEDQIIIYGLRTRLVW